MQLDILITIFFTSIVQSIFGTGVLLIGTPILLILGYDFQFALIILLPTSLLINLSQLINKYNHVDFIFFKNLVLWSIPQVVVFLYFISFNVLNINLFIGILLIIFALKDIFPQVQKSLNNIIRFEKIFLILTGIIHGITNLGGALLSAAVYNKNLSKIETRSTIAACYLTFAVFQIITLILFIDNKDFFIMFNLRYWILGLILFLLTEKFIFSLINEKNYSRFFTIFILAIGILILF